MSVAHEDVGISKAERTRTHTRASAEATTVDRLRAPHWKGITIRILLQPLRGLIYHACKFASRYQFLQTRIPLIDVASPGKRSASPNMPEHLARHL